MRASIISIGNELTQGRVINTNSSYIARKLTLLGFDVVLIASVPDSKDLIKEILNIATANFSSNIVITTGGLGPTYDDITSEALSEYLNEDHELNDTALKMIKQKYEEKNLELTPERIKMAYMPKSASPIPNPVGTAPGIFIERENLTLIALPGVPAEMQAMWERYVEPKLKRFATRKISETTVKIKGIPESSAASIINKYARKDPRVYIKSHPKGYELDKPVIDLYIMASERDEISSRNLCRDICREITLELKNNGALIEGDPDEICKC